MGAEGQKSVGQRKAVQSNKADDQRKEGLIWAQSWKVQAIVAGKSQCQELEVAGRVASGVRKQREC